MEHTARPVDARSQIEAERRASIRNVGRIATLLERQQHALSRSDRISLAISRFVGSLWFVGMHLALFAGWAVWNLGAPRAWRFDPYPFGLLTMLVSLEGVLVATFVLVTQNRMSAWADRRDHLHLQIDMLSEQETTALLQLVRHMAQELGVRPMQEPAEELAKETDVHELLEQIETRLPLE